MINITFDLETLGNTSEAPIVQIGAVKFNNDGVILDKFLRTITSNSLENYNFKINYETLYWWFQQKDEAIKSVFGESIKKTPLKQALYEFMQWLEKPSKYIYWSHATFDPPILNNNFIKVGIKNPIPFRLHRDIRTLNHFTNIDKIERNGIHHNALDDCIFQAEYIYKMIKQLKNNGKNR